MQPCALFSWVVTFLLLSEANCSTEGQFQVRLGEGGRSSAGRAAAILKQGRGACFLFVFLWVRLLNLFLLQMRSRAHFGW